MTKVCKKCNAKFILSDTLCGFLNERLLPHPTLCPDCTDQRRASFRNERHFYTNVCHLCKKPIVTMYRSDSPYHALCKDCWWSDKWDACEIGRDFDFGRPFFEQYADLMKDAMWLYLFGTRNVNSEYVNQETDDKNCYHNAGGHFNEDCYYNTYSIYSKDTVDGYWIIKSELCYECVQCERCFECDFCQDCEGCSDCTFCKECLSCENCFGSFGLRHKKFYVFNEQYSKKDYENFIKENKGRYVLDAALHAEIASHFVKFPQPFAHHKRCEDSSGDYLLNTKNTLNSFLAENTWDCGNLYVGLDLKNCFDCTSFAWAELCYEVGSSIELYDCQFCSSTINVKFGQYCYQCQNSEHLFGCSGAKGKKYCILNKQYSEEEYFKLRERIIQHMREGGGGAGQTGEYGEFFPMELSPFKYTDSVANDYFPEVK